MLSRPEFFIACLLTLVACKNCVIITHNDTVGCSREHLLSVEHLRSKHFSNRTEHFPLRTIVVDAVFNQQYVFNVNQTLQYLIVYKIYSHRNSTKAVRVSSSSLKAGLVFPVAFIARQQHGVLSWQLPFILDYSYVYHHMERTLCPTEEWQSEKIVLRKIYIDVSTMSANNINFVFYAKLLDHFEIRHSIDHTTVVRPSEPQFFKYTFPQDTDVVRLTVSSVDKACAVVSVQPMQCPVFDLIRNIDFEGYHLTMTTQAAILIDRDNFATDGAFFIVFAMKPNPLACGVDYDRPRPANSTESMKNVSFFVEKTISKNEYYVAVGAAGAVFAGFYVATIVVACVQHLCCSVPVQVSARDDMASAIERRGGNGYGSIPVQGACAANNWMGSIGDGGDVTVGARINGEDCGEDDLDLSDIDFLSDASMEKEVVRSKTALVVSDLARKSHKHLSKTFKVYHWNLLTIAVFYGLPAVQLVLTYQQNLLTTGDLDLCYYNFDCANPIHGLSAFNNVVSNMGYVLLGFLFIIIVWCRDRTHQKLLFNKPLIEATYGIPKHFGLLYAMGLAMFMEGVMSASYHVCPTHSNFQFDTSFMYIIACLCLLKIYETRHPDVQAKAYQSYFTMAIVVFVAVLGVIYDSNIFWILYALTHMLITLILSCKIYYLGQFKIDGGWVKRLLRFVLRPVLSDFHPMYTNRFVLLLIGSIINCTFAVFGAIQRPTDFASYLLAIIIDNLLLYLVFYIIMKVSLLSVTWSQPSRDILRRVYGRFRREMSSLHVRFSGGALRLCHAFSSQLSAAPDVSTPDKFPMRRVRLMVSRERIKCEVVVMITAAIISWAFAFYFFFKHLTSWQLSPARSRERNRSCILLNFYDAHDVWHFLSAISLFMSFMVLLTLDDDLTLQQRRLIHVF